MAGSQKRGFGSMSQDKQREIARKGGQAGHAKGTAHEFTPEEARAAGRKGGESVSRDRAHMAEIARKAGRSSSRRRAGAGQDSPQAVGDGEHQTATDLIRDDHEHVKGLFHDYEMTDEEDLEGRHAIASRAFTEIEVHSKIEEEIFYPAVREQAGQHAAELVDEGLEEHAAVKELVVELRRMSPDDEEFDTKFQDLIDNVLHHVEEEESEMLPLAEEKMGDVLQDLGDEILERRRQLMHAGQVD